MTGIINKRRAHGDEGFTLIEMLIVIIILGVLAAVVVFSVRGINDRGQNSACRASKTALNTGLESYYAKTGDYPPDLNALKPNYVSDFGGTISVVPGPPPSQLLTPNNSNSTWTLSYSYTAASGATPASYVLTASVATC